MRHGANNPTRGGGGDGSQDGARSPARSFVIFGGDVTSPTNRPTTECWKESGPSERGSLVVVVKQGGLVFGRGGRISGPWKRNSNVTSKCASDTESLFLVAEPRYLKDLCILDFHSKSPDLVTIILDLSKVTVPEE